MDIKNIEKVSEEIQEEIKKGETSIDVFNPLKAELKKVEQFLDDVEIREATAITDETLKDYKKLRTGINKVLKHVKDRRMDITRSLDELKKQFTGAEKEMVEKIVEKGEEIKNVIDEVTEMKKIEERKKALPERREKLGKLKEIAQLADEVLMMMDDKEWADFLMEAMEQNQNAINEKQEQKEREEQIKREAEAKAKKEADDKVRQLEFEKEQTIKAEKKAKEDEKKEQEKLHSDLEYRAWLKDNKFNKLTDIVRKEEQGLVLYRKVSVYEN